MLLIFLQDEEPLEESDHFIVEFDHGVCRLTINDIFLEDEAEYKCTAVNDLGSTSTIIELFVESKPSSMNFFLSPWQLALIEILNIITSLTRPVNVYNLADMHNYCLKIQQ